MYPPRMKDVSHKPVTTRKAVAEAFIFTSWVRESPKGSVECTAAVCATAAAKETSRLLPLCHPIFTDSVEVDVEYEQAAGGFRVTARVISRAPTGPEMEALHACSAAALCIYDMLKGVAPAMNVQGPWLRHKSGGGSGTKDIPPPRPRFGRVVSINLAAKKGDPKQAVRRAVFIRGEGMEGDAHRGTKRQISMLDVESISLIENELGEPLPPGAFGENITYWGPPLYRYPVGTRVRTGDVLLEISAIGKECHSGCSIERRVGRCVMPHRGVFLHVLEGGVVESGDRIFVLEPPADATGEDRGEP